MNLLLVLFNLIPAFPMDGGRVLRALLAMRVDRVRATQISARTGQVIAFLFGLIGLTSGNLLLLLIAAFVFLAAAAESSDVALHASAHDVPVRDAMITSFEVLAPDDSLEAAARALVRTTQSEFPVLNLDGHFLGMLTRTTIAAELQDEGNLKRVSAVMTRDIPKVRLEDPLETALDVLSQTSAHAVAVIDRHDTFLGYITRENIGEWMILRRHRRRRF